MSGLARQGLVGPGEEPIREGAGVCHWLFDGAGREPGDAFTLDRLMAGEVALEVAGEDGFETAGANRLSEISRPPRALVDHAMGVRHQYPDGLALFLGTMFVPTGDRLGPASGFTHRVGDRVTIREHALGSLVNWVGLSEALPRWQLGIRGLVANLAARGLLQHPAAGDVH